MKNLFLCVVTCLSALIQLNAQNFILEITGEQDLYESETATIDYRGTDGSVGFSGDSGAVFTGDFDDEYWPEETVVNGNIVNVETNGSGQIVIQCSTSSNVCFIVHSVAETFPNKIQNYIQIPDIEKQVYANEVRVIPDGEGGYEIQMEGEVLIEDLEGYEMMACATAHTICGIASGISQYGEYYFVTCHYSNNLCITLNI